MSTKNGFKILLIEPCDDTGTTLALLLEMYGCVVKIVNNFLHACASVATFQPDVILTELASVEDMNIAERLKQILQDRNAQVIALTSWYWVGIEDNLLEAGFMQYMLKPAPLDCLVEILTSLAALRGYSLKKPRDKEFPGFLSLAV